MLFVKGIFSRKLGKYRMMGRFKGIKRLMYKIIHSIRNRYPKDDKYFSFVR